ncbi:MAG: LysR family transcriptional regulator [Acidiferrobacterales bacterium]|nr:LysR family transcriptional regulator [Acidiferrobacterales bacterium]
MNKFRNLLPPLSSLLPFEAAARLGSITKAGEELGLTQAAVSRQIKSLESNLNVELFTRRNRAIHLTEDGEEFRQSVSSALETIAGSSMRLRERKKSGEIVLFAQLCEGLYWVMPRLSNFYQQHPNIEVRVPVSTRPITEFVEYFDIALQTTGRQSGDCEKVFTVPDEVFPVCSPGYLKKIQNAVTLSDLPDHHLLHHRVYPQDWIDWDDWLKDLGADIRVGLKGTIYDSYPMMIQSAIEGHGLALAWRQTTDRLLESGALVRPLKESLYLQDGLSVYRHPQCSVTPELETFIGWLQRELLGEAYCETSS